MRNFTRILIEPKCILFYIGFYFIFTFSAFGQAAIDTDNDGVPDTVDLDDDNDGILDVEDDFSPLFYNFDVDSEGWIQTNENSAIENEITHSSGGFTQFGCSLDGVPESPTNTGFIIMTDVTGGTSFFKSPTNLNLDVTLSVGGNFTFEWINGTPDNGGDQFTNFLPLEIEFEGGGRSIVTEIDVTGLHNQGWQTLSAPLTADNWTGSEEDFNVVMADLDRINIQVETIFERTVPSQVNCDEGEYFGIDQFRFIANTDSDGDGIPNIRDLDSDNDGIYDVVENEGIDRNNDGRADDTDGDSMNANGVPSTANGGLRVLSSDADGIPNMFDTDSDSDACADANEGYGNSATDPDSDGIFGTGTPTVDTDGKVEGASYVLVSAFAFRNPDDTTSCTVPGEDLDSDGDGILDFVDLDDDNDGILDTDESCLAFTFDQTNEGWTHNTNGGETLGSVVHSSETTTNRGCPVADVPANPNQTGFILLTDPFGGLTFFESPDNMNKDVSLAKGTSISFNWINGTPDGSGVQMVPTLPILMRLTGAGRTIEGRVEATGLSNKGWLQLSVRLSPNLWSGTEADFDAVLADLDQIKVRVETIYRKTVPDRADCATGEYMAIDNFIINKDTDGDGIVNALDGDSDNDGCVDTNEAYEAIVDSDENGFFGSGTPPEVNIDGTVVRASYNPTTGGLANALNADIQVGCEIAFEDNDEDGVADSVDLDDDNDGILDTVEGGEDRDGDGVPNFFDLDSDNDGLYDVVENNGTDADNDGRADDTDGDTLNEQGVPSTANGGLTLVDSDRNGTPDMFDLDSDKDGCVDGNEAYEQEVDEDSNGVFGQGPPPVDEDGKVIAASYVLIDTENYTDPTIRIACAVPTSTTDTDNDGILDNVDVDDDNDGILDEDEVCLAYTFNDDTQNWTYNTNAEATLGNVVHSTAANTQLGCAVSDIPRNPNNSEFILLTDPLGGLTFFESPTDMNVDVSASKGATLSFDWINGAGDNGGDQTASTLPMLVRLFGANGKLVEGRIDEVRGMINTGWKQLSIELIPSRWSGTEQDLDDVLADLDQIQIRVETILGRTVPSEVGCDMGEYFAIDNVFFNKDTDGDGIINSLDTDSDEDMCADVDEVYGGGTDEDGNGYFGTGIPEVNPDGSVVAADYRDVPNRVLDNQDTTACDVPMLTIQDASAEEGEIIVFPVTLSAPQSTDTVITFVLTNGTATNDDYTSTPVMITIPAGETEALVEVPTTEDELVEPDETFTIAVDRDNSNPLGVTNTATGTIINDDDDQIDAIDDLVETEQGVSQETDMLEIDILDNDLNIPVNDGGTLIIVEGEGPANGTVTIDDNDTPEDISDDFVVYNPDDSFIGTDTFTYEVCTKNNECDRAVVTIEVRRRQSDEEDNIEIYTGFSPNGDGVNEEFRIINLDQDNITSNSLEIFNRWGVKVYEAENYGENGKFFRGESNGRATVGSDQLPAGTYYYVLTYTLNTGEVKNRAGYVYMNL